MPVRKQDLPNGCKLQFSLPALGVYISAESPLARDRWLNPKHEQGTMDKPIFLWAWVL